ncbi:alkaline phosphatase [Pseudonocardiaceae bacterium YIM PH 21723]|nr:alkaline phosphatase [Pseudonocardiaceae bacterium YIM PH 21723]
MSASSFSRRAALLGGATAGLAVAAAGSTAWGTPSEKISNPFTLGVASGEPLPDSVVLWTRLAPKPLSDDGGGGMPNREFEVEYEIATDENFRNVVQRDRDTAYPQEGHSIHIEAYDLEPEREYFYRFRTEGYLSPVGRTRTAPEPDRLSPLTIASVSCSQYEHGYFTAYRRLAEDRPDLVLHLGDYQYEYKKGDYVIPGGNVRDHVGPETVTLANYRQRYAQYKTDPDLQAAHAAAPWLTVFDDHEVENNWAGFTPEESDHATPEEFRARRAAAFQAYWENMPLRRAQRPRGVDIQLYRRVRWGSMVDFHMLDTRQYRDDQACGDGLKACDERLNPKRTITGQRQQDWLIDGFHRSTARWDVLGQQVFFAQLDFLPGIGEITNMDAWDGYAANRDRIIAGWTESQARNLVVLTGDVHTAWGCDIKEKWNDRGSRTVGTELVSTSITSGGDGSEWRPETGPVLLENPHIKFFNNRRGYVRTRFTATEAHADFRAVDTVRTPGAPVTTKGSFVIEDRNPGLQKS